MYDFSMFFDALDDYIDFKINDDKGNDKRDPAQKREHKEYLIERMRFGANGPGDDE